MSGSAGEVTLLLAQIREGSQEAVNRLAPLIYDDLRRMAGAYMRRERSDHTLPATGLVHEAYVRMVGGESAPWQNRAHFFAIAAHTMREVLLDYARRRSAAKRGGPRGRNVDLEANLLIDENNIEDVIAVDQALEQLAQIDSRQCRLVELRYFAGLSLEETAEVMGLSAITIKREWRSAKAWLHQQLSGAERE